MNIDVNNIVRSVLIAVAIAPVSFAAAGSINYQTESARADAEVNGANVVIDEHRDALTKPCIDFKLSKADSTLEREAKTAIDKYMGGEVLYGATCNWVLGLV